MNALRCVNAYEVDRAYGGPEEGGWWYGTGVPLGSIPVRTEEEEQAAHAHLETMLRPMYKGLPPVHSVACVGQLDIRTEETVAEAYPAVRPHYE